MANRRIEKLKKNSNTDQNDINSESKNRKRK